MQLIQDDEIDFDFYARETEAKQNVRSASVYVQALLDRMSSPVRERHAFMPWGKTHRLIQFRPGELTVWGGPNGSGKSLITGQVALSLAAQDEKVAIASFEMKPLKTMERMGRQWTHHSITDQQLLCDPTERRALERKWQDFRDWTDTRVWLYDKQGTVEWSQVCAVARYCAKELGISHFVVDNLMKCVAGEDDYNAQKTFVDTLTAVARDNDIHIHLIHHIKKPPSEDAKPGKYDFKGTGAITDLADNVIAVWRNKTKERARQAKKLVSETEPDAMLIVDKQRNGDGWEGNIALWFDAQSQQYLAGHNSERMEFISAPEDEPYDFAD